MEATIVLGESMAMDDLVPEDLVRDLVMTIAEGVSRPAETSPEVVDELVDVLQGGEPQHCP